MANRKRKFYIDEEIAVQLFKSYGFDVKIMNFYTIRLIPEEYKNMYFDWYHTQGTLVQTFYGKCRRIASRMGDPEDVANKINRLIS